MLPMVLKVVPMTAFSQVAFSLNNVGLGRTQITWLATPLQCSPST